MFLLQGFLFNICYYKKGNSYCLLRGFSGLSGKLLNWKKPPYKVLFFGSDDFSLYSLETLFKEYERSKNVVKSLDIVANTEKGRLYTFSRTKNLPIHRWPPSIEENKYDVGLIVSFGHLIPSTIINKFPLGMINVHASLLPRWRGASPVIYSIASGDTETGISIMKVEPKHFDTGPILLQRKIDIPPTIIMPDLREKLGKLGAECLMETLEDLPEKLVNARPQGAEGVCYAPKITAQFAKINWNLMTSTQVYNLERALKFLYHLSTTWNSLPVRLFDLEVLDWETELHEPGYINYDRKRRCLVVECANQTWVGVKYVAVAEKKPIPAENFNQSYVRKATDRILGKLFK